MTTVTPFLWFDSGIRDAVARYREVFGDVAVVSDDVFPGGDPGDPASSGTLVVAFSVFGQKVMGMDAGPHFPQTEAFSFYVRCDGQDEVDRYWDGLIADGGEPSQCGWLKDPWGVSWQIVPEALERLSLDADREAALRVQKAMLGMQKIIVADLESAYAGS
jgi:predicted 3-demethylubiquinone-9 3-methyltransferase (glyoxalase superfamily)